MLLKSGLVKNLELCKCVNISSILGRSPNFITHTFYFQVLLVVGNLVFYSQYKVFFVSFTGKPGGHLLDTIIIADI